MVGFLMPGWLPPQDKRYAEFVPREREAFFEAIEAIDLPQDRFEGLCAELNRNRSYLEKKKKPPLIHEDLLASDFAYILVATLVKFKKFAPVARKIYCLRGDLNHREFVINILSQIYYLAKKGNDHCLFLYGHESFKPRTKYAEMVDREPQQLRKFYEKANMADEFGFNFWRDKLQQRLRKENKRWRLDTKDILFIGLYDREFDGDPCSAIMMAATYGITYTRYSECVDEIKDFLSSEGFTTPLKWFICNKKRSYTKREKSVVPGPTSACGAITSFIDDETVESDDSHVVSNQMECTSLDSAAYPAALPHNGSGVSDNQWLNNEPSGGQFEQGPTILSGTHDCFAPSNGQMDNANIALLLSSFDAIVDGGFLSSMPSSATPTFIEDRAEDNPQVVSIPMGYASLDSAAHPATLPPYSAASDAPKGDDWFGSLMDEFGVTQQHQPAQVPALLSSASASACSAPAVDQMEDDDCYIVEVLPSNNASASANLLDNLPISTFIDNEVVADSDLQAAGDTSLDSACDPSNDDLGWVLAEVDGMAGPGVLTEDKILSALKPVAPLSNASVQAHSRPMPFGGKR
jgi:hypothetical protein